MATDNDDASEYEASQQRIGGEPIDGDGSYPFAGLTRFDDDVDAMTLPETLADQHSSMAYWARNEGAHLIGGPDDPAGVDRDVAADILPERGLNTLIGDLPRANHAQAAWVHPRTGKVMETTKHNAVIDPDRAEDAVGGYANYPAAIADVTGRDESAVAEDLREMSLTDYMEEYLNHQQREAIEEAGVGDDALFQIAGQNHTIINPQQPLEELVGELQSRDLGDKVFGEVTLDRDGGRATLDIYMDGHHVESPVFAEDREPIVVGLQVQYSFYDDWAFRACGQGLDWACTNAIHRLTDREVVKYAGDVEGRQDWREWWSGLLDRLDEKRDQLARVIQQASEESLDFSDLPADIDEHFEDADAGPWTALYAYMGLPQYLAEHAGKRLRQQADDAYNPTWWDIHSGATYAVTHHDRGDPTAGGSYEVHARIANDMLMNPAAMEERIVENYEADRLDDEQSTLAEEGGGTAEIRTAFESVREKKERYEEWEQDLREMGVEV
jgi:hypothetical protein